MFKNFGKIISLLLAITIILTGCNLNGAVSDNSSGIESEASGNEESQEESNNKEKPRLEDNYYDNINFDWLAETPPHPSVPKINSFSEIATDIYSQLFKDLIKDLEDTGGYGETDQNKLIRFFLTASDWENRNKRGVMPLLPFLIKISAITNIKELQKVAAEIDLDMIGTFSMFSIKPDKKDTTINRLYLSGPVLIMGEKSYYFDETEAGIENIENYTKYMEKLLALSGYTAEIAQKIAANAKEIETYFADSVLSIEEAQDDDLTYNKFSLSEFSSQLTNFDLTGFLERVKLVNPEFIIVSEVDYYHSLDKVMTEENLDKLKDYMLVQTLHQAGEWLSSDFIHAKKDFDNIRNGTTGYRGNLEESFFLTEAYLGELLGKNFVEKYFSEEDKEYVEEMVYQIIDMYEKRINSLDWMSEATKEKAVDKLKAVTVKVGYPDKWTDYSNLEVSVYNDGMDGSVVKNIMNFYRFDYDDFINELDQPVNESEWAMRAYEPNAYYNPTFNEIVFPAGILQEPFFSHDYTQSQNLGSIGTVIAHEISHAFDDSGRKFDKDGNRADWWTAADLESYQVKADLLIEQYNNLEILPGYKVNGKLTLSENIADLGAVSCITSIVESLDDGSLEDMFEGYARIWRSNSTEKFAINMLTEDVHAPDIFRTNSTLSNIEQFYTTYNITESDKMYRPIEQRVVIW